ncbi:MAG TPA: GTP-binding protein [Flavilitoribacter sp.]|nr:GTP-binding protein [Flavilitoribacter sp.]
MDILRIATAGSVDDGKSTLIGRLLYETNSVTQDKLEAIERASRRLGLEHVDLSLLTDGLIAEREQGITIDVAHIYFSTRNRKYIIADTPGHFEYTRNMITGASTAQVAIILIDARNGIVEQTYRHYYITQLLRIPHVAVCINKMDLVNYSENQFNSIRREFQELLGGQELPEQEITFIPVSSLYGENISKPSVEMPWYNGPFLLDYLENIEWHAGENHLPSRFPVQYVIRPKSEAFPDFRGFAGKVASGVFKAGDRVVAYPSMQESEIDHIYAYQDPVDRAEAGQSAVITLKDEIDLSRGDMLVRKEDAVTAVKDLEARICWLDSAPLRAGRNYLLQHGQNRVKARVVQLSHIVDIQNYSIIEGAEEIGLNQIGGISIKTAKPVFTDRFRENKHNGAFILIDEGSNNTVGVGVVV